jgi:hypothetical protein
MLHSPLHQGWAAVWLALAVGFSAPAMAAAPVLVGSPMPLDRLGALAGTPYSNPRLILAVGNGAGQFAMCWHATDTLVQARVYSQSGPPRTPVIEVTQQGTSSTQIAMDLDPAGNLLVAWLKDRDAVTGLFTLASRRFAADGSPAGGEMLVATGVAPTGSHTDFLVKLAPDGSFLALWQHGTVTPSGRSLVARAFGPAGQAKGPEAVLNATEENFFTNIALDLEGDRAIAAYGRTRRDAGNQVVSDLWARSLDSAGALTSAEIALPLPTPFGGFEPIGARMRAAGGFALVYAHCDPITLDALCDRMGILEANAAGSILASHDVSQGINGFGSRDGRMAPDPQGNLAILAHNGSQDSFAASNPFIAVGAQISLPPSSLSQSASLAGLVALGPGQFGWTWYQNDWTYFQSIDVGPESASAPSFYTLEPCRLIDTRVGGPAFAAGEDRSIPASGHCSIPQGARALAANLVSVGSTNAGNLVTYRPDRLVPPTSALNYRPGQVRANSAVISLDGSGALALRATGTTDVIIDVSGYFQ